MTTHIFWLKKSNEIQKRKQNWKNSEDTFQRSGQKLDAQNQADVCRNSNFKWKNLDIRKK
ncbi:hypothetical protein BLA29_002412 [Euroglyphus maynei]|uniref:Uncharacterized protein n=1 Tax=Euroglyphus maynei TaxID=6958 RepID=A0A1Y3AYJ0_EURMA|nr:hypothetical protein BLA29_002412 [Euroglyphus maynei]